MREPVRDKGRLEHMLDAIQNVEQYTEGVTSCQELRSDRMRLHATAYNVQIIGEATYKLTHEFRDTHTATPWRVIEKMRHILVHDYFAVDPEILWLVIKEDLPLLKPQVIQYIQELS